MPSAYQHPSIVDDYLAKEQSAYRIIGPLDPQRLPHAKVSPFGVIPKHHQPNKWRLILNLSAPEGFSVNDGIAREASSLSLVSVDNIAATVLSLGKGALLAKLDIQAAFRIIPVHPDDRHFLGMQWRKELYIDATLPFGLRSAPQIFSAVADGLEWIIRSRGVQNITHYIDDFIIVGPPDSLQCTADLETTLSACAELGVPIASSKTEGPSTCLTILGIEVDTRLMELRLPQDKILLLTTELEAWHEASYCTRKELESLIGLLSHACTVVRPGRRFLRALLNLLPVAKKPHHHIRLNADFKSDIEWWRSFLELWNGVSILSLGPANPPDLHVWSDASGSWGCAAIWYPHWFQVSWDLAHSFSRASIAAKELLPILLAACVWGAHWKGLTVQCNCDNQAVVSILNSGSAKDSHLAHMLRCLFFLESLFDFSVVAWHIPGHTNTMADALSRNQLLPFLHHYPQASPHPTPIPPDWIPHLTDPTMIWTSQSWINWFSSISATH